MALTDSHGVARSRGQRAHHYVPQAKPEDIQGYVSTVRATQALSTVYTMGDFIHYPCLSFRGSLEGTDELWLQMIDFYEERQLHSISFFFFSFLSEALPVLYPMSQIPAYNLVTPSTVTGSEQSISTKPLPTTLIPSISLFHKQDSSECTTQFGFDICIFGFLFITRNRVCVSSCQ